MTKKEAEAMIEYYSAIPYMIKLLRSDYKQLESAYNTVRSAPLDSMPHGTTPGNPTENAGVLCAQNNVFDQVKNIEDRILELESDREYISAALNAINGKYKYILIAKYCNKYSWAKISVKMQTPDSTVRLWRDKALLKLGKALEEKGYTAGVLERASRARI